MAATSAMKSRVAKAKGGGTQQVASEDFGLGQGFGQIADQRQKRLIRAKVFLAGIAGQVERDHRARQAKRPGQTTGIVVNQFGGAGRADNHRFWFETVMGSAGRRSAVRPAVDPDRHDGALYALGAHGIMTLTYCKPLEGDKLHGVRSLPVVLGPEVAARIACTVMALAQLLVISPMMIRDRPWHGLAITALLVAQVFAMRVLLRDPKGRAPWYNGTGVLFYVSGMMIAAFALRGMWC